MTFTAFAVMSIVMFFLFLAWYQFVHRNGESTPQGLEDTRVIGIDRRHLQGRLATETGTIGELDEDGQPSGNPNKYNGDTITSHPEKRHPKDWLRDVNDKQSTEFGETFGAYEDDDLRYRLFPERAQSKVNTGRMEGVFPPPDVEFATLPTAHFENLSNQLPVADDTVMFKEGTCEKKQQ